LWRLAGLQFAGSARRTRVLRPAHGILDRLNAMVGEGKSAWTPEQRRTMERLRDAAMKDPYALDQLRYLTDNIGPRLSGSPQAAKRWNMWLRRCARWARR
jgi:hypothetical protein